LKLLYETENKPSSISHEFLDSVLSFGSDFLGLDCDLILNFEDLEEGLHGICDYDEDEIIIFLNKNLDGQALAKTIFHELTHVKQYLEGTLEDHMVWKDERYDCSYLERPWEQQAYELEEQMMKGWKYG